jgi:hypothetical protein
MNDTSQPASKLFMRSAWILLALSFVQTVSVWLAFDRRILTEVIYSLGKAVMVFAPPLWILILRLPWRERLKHWGFSYRRGDLLWGFGSGALIVATIALVWLGFYRGTLHAEGIIKTLPTFMTTHFWVAAFAVSCWNSLLEEYFWRGFLFTELSTRIGGVAALLLNGLIFGLHHYILLDHFFPDGPAAFFAFGTMLGGWIWCGLRLRGNTLVACYISHMMADLALMAIGYKVLFG